MGVPSGHGGRARHVELAPDLDGVGALGRVHHDGAAVGVLEVELPVVHLVGLVPTHVDLERDARRHRVGARQGPATPEHEQLPVGDLRRVAQQHRDLHARQATAGSVLARAERPARRRLPAPAGHRPRAPRPSRPGGAAWTSAPAVGTCRWRWPRSWATTDASTPSTATRAPATRWPRRRRRSARCSPSPRRARTCSCPRRSTWPSAGSCSCTSSTRPSCSTACARRCGPAGGWWPRSPSPRRVGWAASPLSMPDARHPDVGALLPALVRDAGLDIVDAWAEAPAGVGPGPWPRTSARSPASIPGDDPVVLPPLVTVLGRVPGARRGRA